MGCKAIESFDRLFPISNETTCQRLDLRKKMDDSKKSFPLRLSQSLFDEIKKWAEQEMRSVNGQIEFLLRESVKKRTGKTNPIESGTKPMADSGNKPQAD